VGLVILFPFCKKIKLCKNKPFSRFLFLTREIHFVFSRNNGLPHVVLLAAAYNTHVLLQVRIVISAVLARSALGLETEFDCEGHIFLNAVYFFS
jgi:hypothetical protein